MKMTIAEFAKEAKISPQAIYKRRRNDEALNAMIEEVNGTLVIDSAAFDLFGTKPGSDKEDVPGIRIEYEHRIEMLQKELTLTQERLKDKEAIIANLNQQLLTKDIQITKANEAQHEAHVLLAQTTAQLTEALKPKGITGFFARLLPGKHSRVQSAEGQDD